MYGLVNQGVKDLVIHLSSAEVWNSICHEADVPTDFVAMEYYSDEITYRLIGIVSKRFSLPKEKILEKFGKHWVAYTAHEGYGPIMDLFGQDFKSCLRNLNQLHIRMGMTMPNLNPPNFEYREVQYNIIELEYQSSRAGLSPMVQGLLEGLAAKYKVNINLRYQEINDRKIFTINIMETK